MPLSRSGAVLACPRTGPRTVPRSRPRTSACGKSLLPAGVREVQGRFEKGACLRILNMEGRELARGIAGYGSGDADAIRGASRGEAAIRLGYSGPTAIIHRNDLVLM